MISSRRTARPYGFPFPFRMFEPRQWWFAGGMLLLAQIALATPELHPVLGHFVENNCVDCHDSDIRKGGLAASI
jgi:hypothetical protein